MATAKAKAKGSKSHKAGAGANAGQIQAEAPPDPLLVVRIAKFEERIAKLEEDCAKLAIMPAVVSPEALTEKKRCDVSAATGRPTAEETVSRPLRRVK